METDKDIDSLMEEDFLKGLSPDRKEILRRWVEADEEHRKYYERRILLYRWLRIQSRIPLFDKEQRKAYRRFLSRAYGSGIRRPVTVRMGRKKWLSVAAVLLLALGSGVLIWHQTGDEQELQQSCSSSRTITVPEGVKYRMMLADGSHVWLNSGSSLTLSAGFGQENRDLRLEGEALFEVTKNKQLPFVIRSGDIYVRVTGTVFNFKAYSKERFAKITLLQGSLNVSKEHDAMSHSVTLRPNEQVLVDRYDDVLEKKEVEAAADVEWANVGGGSDTEDHKGADMEDVDRQESDALFFDEVSMAEIIRRLENVFHVYIKIDYPELLQKKYYGDFRGKRDVFDILDVIVRGESVAYQIKGDTIFITE